MKFLFLILDNVRRNITRTILTSLGTMVLVLVVTGVWSILEFLNNATSEKTSNIKAIVTEKWRLPSQMPFSYATALHEGAAKEPGDVKPNDYMSWTFYGGSTSTDPKQRTMTNTLFAFCMEPEKLTTMMDELDSLKGDKKKEFDAVVQKLKDTPNGIIVGKTKLTQLEKQVGDTITLYGLNYKDIDLELVIVGTFPVPRYDQSCSMDIEYFNRALFDDYPNKHNGQPHPMAQKSLNLVWVRVPDTDKFTRVADQIMKSPSFANPAVKVETASSGIASFLQAYKSIFDGMQYLLAPMIIIILAVVIANSISLSVRERRLEFAIMKVLGYGPGHILALVVGEALFIGGVSGTFSAWATYYVVNEWAGGIPFPIAFFPAFMISERAPWWGLAIGTGAALLGSIIPAINACRVRVAEVFGRVG